MLLPMTLARLSFIIPIAPSKKSPRHGIFDRINFLGCHIIHQFFVSLQFHEPLHGCDKYLPIIADHHLRSTSSGSKFFQGPLKFLFRQIFA